jgi:peptidoglycan/LPS O-acetylase OafA/YrhL
MHRTEIDGLRAIAVLSVIFNHIDKALLPNGHLGVDIFFVISGFVITQSIVSRQYCSFRDYIHGFYARRIKRLVPALFLCIAVTSIFVLLIISPDSSLSSASLRTGVSALFGISNLFLLAQTADYFGSPAKLNPLTHTWSLGIEEQFYLFFPLLLWFSGLPQKSTAAFSKFSLIIGIFAIASLMSYLWLSKINPIAAFYLMPARFWELALGAGAYLALIRTKKANPYHFLESYIVLPCLVALIVILFIPQLPQYNWLNTIFIALLTAVLIIGIHPTSFIYKLLTLKPLVFLGIISYSLYLWHWSVLTIGRWTIGIDAWTIPIQLAIILLLSVLSYKFVENPLRKSVWPTIKFGDFQTQETGVAVATSLGLALLIVFAARPLHKQGYLYTGATATLIKKGVKTLKENQTYKDYVWVASRCVLSSNDEVGKIIRQEDCTFGDFRTAKRHFLVIGNSYSAAEIELYKILVAEKRGSVTITSSWAASIVPEVENRSTWDKVSNYYWSSVIPALIDQLQAGDVLLMVNYGAWFSPKKHSEKSIRRLKDLQKGLSRMAEEMAKRGIYIIFQSSNPFIRESNCTPDTAMPQWWHINNEPPCTYYTRVESLQRRRMYHDSLLELERKFENFAVLDLFDVFCASKICRFYNDKGIFLYRDEWSHPSVEASILAQPRLLATVDKLLPEQPIVSGSH